MRAEFVLLPIVVYLIGAIPFGLIIGKLHGIDIRKIGSGNIGATNVTRAVGKTAGRICFACDFLKGYIPVLLTARIWMEYPWLVLAVGLAAQLGHIYPIYLKFKGGKGVAVAAGIAMAMAPFPLLIGLGFWVILFWTTRYVAVASILASAVVPIIAILFHFLNIGDAIARSWSTIAFLILIATLAILRHRSNIIRLLNGTENRFEKKKKKPASTPAEEK